MKKGKAQTAWGLINKAADLIRNCAFGIAGERSENFTVSQQNILATVYSGPEHGMMVKDIAMEVNLTPGAVSQTVETLVRMGIIERVQAEHDRRAVFVRQSAEGKKVHDALLKRINPVFDQVFTELREKDAEMFLEIMGRLVQKLSDVSVQQRNSKRMSARAPVMETKS